MLFLPGNNPNMLINADVFGSDAVIFDLEDAVSPDEKDAARILVRSALNNMDYGEAEIIVRINSIDANGYWMRDLDEVIPCKPAMIMPTKVSDADYIKKISNYIAAIEKRCGMQQGTVKIIPLIETAIGLENAYAIATADARVTAIFLAPRI
jgi:citrate lyase subunit beta/citryl-CoA lyase